jgi:hypothetical protein
MLKPILTCSWHSCCPLKGSFWLVYVPLLVSGPGLGLMTEGAAGPTHTKFLTLTNTLSYLAMQQLGTALHPSIKVLCTCMPFSFFVAAVQAPPPWTYS